MTDKELLELAAKAAGIKGQYFNSDNPIHAGIFLEREQRYWNALENDSDAFRLAVKLEISVVPSMEEGSARNPSYTAWHDEPCHSDPYAATRRAIVRAAAEISENSMKLYMEELKK